MKDDAGKEVRILNPNGFAEWPVRGDRRIALLMTRVFAARHRRGAKFDRVELGVLIVFLICVCIAAAMPWLLLRRVSGLPVWVPLLVFVGTFTSLSLGFAWIQTRRRAETISRVVLAEGLCPSCGYNLYSIAPNDAGCVVCPECAAAWQKVRIERAAAFDQEATMGSALRQLNSGRCRGGLAVDEAGTRVVIPVGLMMSAGVGETISDDMAALSRAKKRWRAVAMWDAGWQFAGMGAAVLGTMLAGVSASKFMLGITTPMIVSGIVAGAMIAAAGLGWLRFRMSRVRNTLVEDLLRERLCPGCFSVLGDELQPSRLSACGYCGAKWRLTPSASATADRPGP